MKRDPLHRFTYAHVKRVLAISSVIHNNVLSTTPVSPERVTTLHFPVDTLRFDPDRVDPHRVREEFNVSREELLVGLVGRFSPGKGHEDLLAAAELLRPRHPNLRFLLVGEASYAEEEYGESIKTLVRSSGLDDIVIFTGFRTDTPEIMAALDILVFPSPAEAFGMVLIEAMSMRLPVVSTNCDGVLDIVVDGVTGFYIDPHAPGQLADAISRFLTDPDLRRNMGREGRKRAVEHFDRQSHLDRLEAIYREIYAGDGDARNRVAV
jgi:glycosyltransferase involved in cell wall biosynthesis